MPSNSPPRQAQVTSAASLQARRPLVIPRRKPMRRAERVSLFEREVRVRLSAAAIEILFGTAAVLSEGQVESGRYYGSTMITIDLSRVSAYIAEACDVATARSLERLLAADPRVNACARRIAAAEAGRLAGSGLGSPQIDVRVHRNDRHFHIDMDTEAITEGMS